MKPAFISLLLMVVGTTAWAQQTAVPAAPLAITGQPATTTEQQPCQQPLRQLKNVNGKMRFVTVHEGNCPTKIPDQPAPMGAAATTSQPAAPTKPPMRSDRTGLRSDRMMNNDR